ncbi:hypothetical protein [Neobacillus sp.]|jgi:hypothetical protein
MSCKCCDSSNATYYILEETKEGYVWQSKCNDCGWNDTGYEF